MKNFLLICVVFGIALVPNSVSAKNTSDLESKVRNSLQRRVVSLQRAYITSRLQFDSRGNLTGDSRMGPWTLYGSIEVTDVQLRRDKLKISGNRLYASYDDVHKQFKYMRVWDRVDITIELAPGISTEQGITALLSNVFITSQRKPADYVPEYWKPFLTDQARGLETAMRTITLGASPEEASQQIFGLAANEEDPIVVAGEKVYRVGGSVTPPHLLSRRDPQYVEVARLQRLQGKVSLLIVIDQSGNVTHTFIIKPVGLGLEDAAAEAVGTWKFDPAKRHGNAVAVVANVDVNFRLQ